MATIAGADDAISTAAIQLPPLARQFDRRFAGFRAAVEQIRLVAAGAVAQAVDEVELGTVMQAVTGIDQRLGLIGQGPDQYLRAVAEAVGRAALAEVQIGAIIAVPQPGTLAAHEDLRGARYGRHQASTGKIFATSIQDQVIQTGRRAAQIEQVHTFPPMATMPWSVYPAKPTWRFFDLPMQTPST